MKTYTVALIALLVLAAPPAIAHEMTSVDNSADWGLNSASQILGMHEMDATVSALDMRTGVVDVIAGGMLLKLHYPPEALAQAAVRAGNRITIHLSFTKP